MKIKLITAFLLIVAFSSELFIGCVPAKPVKEKIVITSSRLIKKIEANRRKIKTFSASGVLQIETPEFFGKGNFEVLLKKPDSLKISIYGPFGIDVAQILVTNSGYMYYDVLKNRLYEGKNKKRILKSIFKIDLSFDDLIDAFAGSINLTDKLSHDPEKYSQSGDYYLFSYINKNSGLKSNYKIRIADLAIESYELYDKKNELVFGGVYDKFKLFNTVPIPYKSLIENRRREQKISLDYRKIKVNRTLYDMGIDLPSDVEIIQW